VAQGDPHRASIADVIPQLVFKPAGSAPGSYSTTNVILRRRNGAGLLHRGGIDEERRLPGRLQGRPEIEQPALIAGLVNEQRGAAGRRALWRSKSGSSAASAFRPVDPHFALVCGRRERRARETRRWRVPFRSLLPPPFAFDHPIIQNRKVTVRAAFLGGEPGDWWPAPASCGCRKPAAGTTTFSTGEIGRVRIDHPCGAPGGSPH